STLAESALECPRTSIARVLGPEHATVESSMMRVLTLKPDDEPDKVRPAIQECLATCQDTLELDDPVLACVSDMLDRWGDGYRLYGGDVALLEPMFRYSLSINKTGKQRASRADSPAR